MNQFHGKPSLFSFSIFSPGDSVNAFSEIDSKYAGIIAGEVESFIKTEATRLEAVYAQRLEAYIRDLAATLARDIEENKDKEVREEYATAITRPVESEYGEQIEALKKRKSKLKEKKHADEIAEIDAEIERLTAEMEEKLESAMAMISIAVYYEARNARRIESQKKSLAIALQKDIERAKAEKKKQLEIQYRTAIDEEKRGLITICEGAKVNYSDVTRWFVDMAQEYKLSPYWVGYDPWNSGYWVEEMKSAGFNMVEVRQGARTLSNPMKTLEADLLEKNLNYNNNPITKWCLCNTNVKRDENDNIRPIKRTKQESKNRWCSKFDYSLCSAI